MAKFESKNGDLLIDGQKIVKGWESYSGWYWFGVNVAWIQDSDFGDRVVKNDKIWYGLVQGFEDEWGNFSQAEIEALGPKAWEIPKQNLPLSGRRS